MAAPAPTPRATPTGIVLKDGHPTKITCLLDTNIEFKEKSVRPPGLDGGTPIDTTTMFNVDYRSMAPRQLAEMTPAQVKAAYDPLCYQSVLLILNVETTWTVTFPDGSTLAFFGFLNKFDPNELQEGAQPEVAITIVPTNADPVTGNEQAAVLTNVAGT